VADDALSQEEIDALLQTVSSGGSVDTAEVGTPAEKESSVETVVYDFKRPKLISKDQKRTIQIIYDIFAKNFTNVLSLYMRTNVEVDLTLIEQFTYGEYVMSLPETTCMNLFSMAPLEGLCVFEVNMPIVSSIIDRLMGGKGGSLEIDRELTEIEKAVFESVVKLGLNQMHDAWKDIIELEFSAEGIETKPQFAQIASVTSNVLLVQFNLSIGKQSGSMSICLPFDVVVPILGKLTAQTWMSSSIKSKQRDTSVIKKQIPDIRTELTVELGKTKLTMRELLELRANDVIFLDRLPHDPVKVRVGGVTKYMARPGISGNKKAVQILQAIE
jgi:flagellar motor switch protein FliM